ncbi:MAG: hypothetical protein K0V04_39220 [Deltaproteobacteria bacterium]|nr:hypothetical protein [Deltaproteobacteria bacterium]
MKTMYAIGVLALALASTACDPEFGEVEIFTLDGSEGSRATSRSFEVPAGGVVVFEAIPRSAGASDYNGLERFELRTTSLDVAEVRRAVLRDTWVINGVRPGSAVIQVRINGETQTTIPVEVLEVAQ